VGKITFILGGARSGKSSYALKIAKDAGGKVAFIATAQAKDAEMKKRIALHKNSRPRGWKTFEEAREPSLILKNIGAKFNVIIIDCLTLMVSNLILSGHKDTVIKNRIHAMLGALEEIKAQSIIVSNEVGLGIVPENKLARAFRDVAGTVNQIVADKSDNVFFLVSGIPWRIK